MTQDSGLTPREPLGGSDRADPPAAVAEPDSGYTSPPPPGAGGPIASTAAAPVAGRWVLAGWWRRVFAHLIDGLIIGAGALVLVLLVVVPLLAGVSSTVTIVVGALLVLLCITVVWLLYAPAMMARTNGKTLGRMATGIRVVRANGQPITFRFAVVREVLVKVLLFALLPGVAHLIDALWPLGDEENRAIHDFIVSTRTIRD